MGGRPATPSRRAWLGRLVAAAAVTVASLAAFTTPVAARDECEAGDAYVPIEVTVTKVVTGDPGGSPTFTFQGVFGLGNGASVTFTACVDVESGLYLSEEVSGDQPADVTWNCTPGPAWTDQDEPFYWAQIPVSDTLEAVSCTVTNNYEQPSEQFIDVFVAKEADDLTAGPWRFEATANGGFAETFWLDNAQQHLLEIPWDGESLSNLRITESDSDGPVEWGCGFADVPPEWSGNGPVAVVENLSGGPLYCFFYNYAGGDDPVDECVDGVCWLEVTVEKRILPETGLPADLDLDGIRVEGDTTAQAPFAPAETGYLYAQVLVRFDPDGTVTVRELIPAGAAQPISIRWACTTRTGGGATAFPSPAPAAAQFTFSAAGLVTASGQPLSQTDFFLDCTVTNTYSSTTTTPTPTAPTPTPPPPTPTTPSPTPSVPTPPTPGTTAPPAPPAPTTTTTSLLPIVVMPTITPPTSSVVSPPAPPASPDQQTPGAPAPPPVIGPGLATDTGPTTDPRPTSGPTGTPSGPSATPSPGSPADPGAQIALATAAGEPPAELEVEVVEEPDDEVVVEVEIPIPEPGQPPTLETVTVGRGDVLDFRTACDIPVTINGADLTRRPDGTYDTAGLQVGDHAVEVRCERRLVAELTVTVVEPATTETAGPQTAAVILLLACVIAVVAFATPGTLRRVGHR